jgi:hypothetical protein
VGGWRTWLAKLADLDILMCLLPILGESALTPNLDPLFASFLGCYGVPSDTDSAKALPLLELKLLLLYHFLTAYF